MIVKNKITNKVKIDRRLLYGVTYFIVSFIIAAVLNSNKENKSSSVIIILFFSLFLPLEILSYYKFREFLNKKGVKTSYQTEGENNIDSFLDEVNYNHNVLSTNIFLNKKNKFLGYTLNFFGDLFINIFMFLYTVAVFAISAFFTWGALKLFNIIFNN